MVKRRSTGRYEARWEGGSKTLSATSRAQAYREAAEIELDLNAVEPDSLAWSTACGLYETLYLSDMSRGHRNKWRTTRHRFEKFFNGEPPAVEKITNRILADFASDVLPQVSNATLRSYCRYLRGFFNWCEYHGYIDRAPVFRLARRKRGAKMSRGRPITLEEFERMLAASERLGFDDSWRFLLKGLWLSSLRLGEAVALHWSHGPVRIEFPLIVFESGDKGGHSALPITRELWAHIEGGKGFVFKPQLSKGVTRSRDTWSHKVSEIGKAAGVIVGQNKDGKPRFATAHDLRRSFLERWRATLTVGELQTLARHASIETTKRYYLGDDAKRMAEKIWG